MTRYTCKHCAKEHEPRQVCAEERAALEKIMRAGAALDKLPSPERSAEDLAQIRKVNDL